MAMFLCRCRLGLMALELWPVRQSMMDRRQLASAVMFCVLAMLLGSTMAFTPPGADTRTFATFGNAHTKQLIQSWQPKPLAVPNGSVLTPASQENMKRFVRARILLEDPSLGCVASFDDALCVILCRFSKAEHQVRHAQGYMSRNAISPIRPSSFSRARWLTGGWSNLVRMRSCSSPSGSPRAPRTKSSRICSLGTRTRLAACRMRPGSTAGTSRRISKPGRR